MKQVNLYERTSTKDQNPQLQHKDNINFCKSRNLNIAMTFSEKLSAYKNEGNLDKRKEWNKCVESAKQNKRDIVLWKYDRCFRNRKEFYIFMREMFEIHNLKVYSVTEPSILSLWNMVKTFDNVQNEMIKNFLKGIIKEIWKLLIQQAGETAEEESKKKGERVKLAIRKQNGITKSYKGNKWGRKSLSKNVIKEVIKKHKLGMSIRQIAQSVCYWDKNNNQKFISKSAVHKILQQENSNNNLV